MAGEPQPAGPGNHRSFGTLILVGALGLVEVLIVYVLLVVETPVAPLVRRAAETVLGRFLLALFGFLLISVGMAALLTCLEWRQRRGGPPGAV